MMKTLGLMTYWSLPLNAMNAVILSIVMNALMCAKKIVVITFVIIALKIINVINTIMR